MIVPARAVDGRSLVAFADALVSAGGTMNREAAVLGHARVVDLRGPLGAVDERLSARAGSASCATRRELDGREEAARRLRARVRRDPAELLGSRCRGSRLSYALPAGMPLPSAGAEHRSTASS